MLSDHFAIFKHQQRRNVTNVVVYRSRFTRGYVNFNNFNFAFKFSRQDFKYWRNRFTWCAPCKAIAPVLEVLSNEYEGKVKIVKVDVTACEQTAVNYNIRNIPALLMFKNGEVVAQQVGAAPKSKLTAFIEENI